MNFQRGRWREPLEINLVPLIDVMMVILIFLMITTTYSKYTELQINLPTADSEKQLERANDITVLVSAQGQYVIDRNPVAFRGVEQLAEALKRAAGTPVNVVGNLTAGARGKTQLVLWIAEFMKSKGWSPGIVSRGYGAKVDAPRAATVADQAAEVGDEPIILSRRSGCPVWVGADRVAVAAALRATHDDVDVLILDDGLQHYRLRRDLEVAVVDSRGFGNGLLLPAGT